MKVKAALFLLLGIMLISNTWAQDQNIPDWAWKTPMTKVYPTGEYYNLPLAQDQVNYQNPNTTTRVINKDGQYFVIPPNVRPFPHTATQSEVEANNMTGNTNNIFASWNSYGPSFYGTGFAFTSNAGVSWTGNFQMIVAGNNGDPGPWIWPAGSTWAGRLGISVIGNAGMAAFYSTDNGTSWTGYTTMGGSSVDKNLSCVDEAVGSPFFGRTYTVWTDFGGANVNRIVGAYSSNGGVSWTGYTPISPVPPGGHHMQGCDVEVGPGGVVYCVWATCTTNGQNSTEDFLGFAKSTDGGVTWPVSNYNVVDINGIRAAALFNGIRANGFPRLAVDRTGGARNGWIYVALSEKNVAPALDVADICIAISSNGGTNWTHTRVNQDPGNGRYNYHPGVVVTPDGGVNVTYYDQRNTSGSVTEYWMSRSLNGGATWTDVAASDHTFTPSPIPGLAGGYQGDYTGVSFGGGKVFPFWADNSSGIYQVWTVGITYGPPPVNDVVVGPFLSLPGSFVAGTNYTIKAKFTNAGSANQTNVPTRFSVNGVQVGTGNIASLPSGAQDSASFTWNPAAAGNYTLRIYSALAVDENRLNDTVTTTVNVSPSGTVILQTGICRNGLNKNITDFSTIYDTININIPTAFNVVDVNCKIDTLTHTWDGDLAFTLSHLAASSGIISNVGGSGDNFIGTMLNDSAVTPIASGTAPFTGTYQPSSPLTAFNNNPTNGLWVLAIADGAGGDTGYLKAWCLYITYQGLLGGIHTVEIPNQYSLSQNYPNPFNPTTTIKYGIPKAGIVTLKIYDLLGREVATLVNERKDPGVYNVDFNATNMASGIYLYKISSGDFSAVKKMMLVK
jgi:hypothetical protein